MQNRLYYTTISVFANVWSRRIYRPVSELAALLWGWIPFSLTEILVYGVLLYTIFAFLRAVVLTFRGGRRQAGAAGMRRPLMQWLRHTLFTAALAFVLYVCFCGINYRRDSFRQENDIVLREYSTEELTGLCEYLAVRINESAVQAAEKNAAGGDFPVPGETEENARNSFSMLAALGKTARQAMTSLGTEYRD